MAKDGVAGDYVFSFMAKLDERHRIQVWLGSQGLDHRVQASLELTSGLVAHVDTHGGDWKNHGAGLVSLEDGWWWCWIAARKQLVDLIDAKATCAD